MILPTYTEKEILAELTKDYSCIKKGAKKRADKILLKVQKTSSFVKETYVDIYTAETPLNNTWKVEIECNPKKKNPWWFRACCIVEGEKKLKDYYLVRGLNTNQPYFVRLTAHAVKRVRERAGFNISGYQTPALLACLTFAYRETALCTRYVDLKFLPLLKNLDDADENKDRSYIVLTGKGTYYAVKTPEGNYIFKTYISRMMGFKEILNFSKGKYSKWSREGELLSSMLIFHQYYNKHLYSKKMLDTMLYTVIPEDHELERAEDSPLLLLRN